MTNNLDRASLGQARLSTLDQDLGLTGYQFGNAISILSAGYVLGQLPSNMIIPYIRPSVYLGCCAFVWSVVAASICGVTSYKGLLIVRFFLGVVEAPLFPGAVYLLSCWYTRKELGVRVAFMATGVPIANGLSGLIAAAVFSSLEGKYGVAGWQWLFIVLAICGAVFGIASALILPDYPASRTGSTMWTMTEDMRRLAEVRMIADRVTVAGVDSETKVTIWKGLRMSVMDYKLWIIIFLNIAISAAYGFSNFFPSIVRGFGYSNVVSLLLTCPPYIFAAIGSLINAWHSDRTSERGYHFAIPIAIGCIGYIICLSTMNGGARYGASFLYVGGMYTANPLISTWVSSTMGRTPENRAIAVALCNVLGQIGNVIAPYFFRESDNPRYQLAFILMMVCAVVAISATTGLKFHLKYLNKKLYQKSLLQGTVYQPYVT